MFLRYAVHPGLIRSPASSPKHFIDILYALVDDNVMLKVSIQTYLTVAFSKFVYENSIFQVVF